MPCSRSGAAQQSCWPCSGCSLHTMASSAAAGRHARVVDNYHGVLWLCSRGTHQCTHHLQATVYLYH
jgi:hypothetical protein